MTNQVFSRLFARNLLKRTIQRLMSDNDSIDSTTSTRNTSMSLSFHTHNKGVMTSPTCLWWIMFWDSILDHTNNVLHISRSLVEMKVYCVAEAISPTQRINGIPWKFFHNERYRLKSFVKFPKESHVSTIKLASKGFVYLENCADVICYFCNTQSTIENGEDHIDEEHKRLGVNCPMVKGTRSNNVKFSNIPLVDNDRNEDHAMQIPEADPDIAIHNSGHRMPIRYENLGIITARYKHLRCSFFANRLHSFNGWPTGHCMRPKDMSRAGFYFTGYIDRVQCFYCGGCLRNWGEQDDALVEHARFFPECAFLLLKFGKRFVNAVQVMKGKTIQITYQRPQESADPLRTENTELQQQALCQICMNNKAAGEFLPCHLISCAKCSKALTNCPLCYAGIIDFKRVRKGKGNSKRF